MRPERRHAAGAALALCLGLAPAVAAEGTAGHDSGITGRLWAATDAGAAPGSLIAFLRDGTLLMQSCVETYALYRWQWLGEDRLGWEESGIPITATITGLDETSLALTLDLVSGPEVKHYRPATVPYLCPETRN